MWYNIACPATGTGHSAGPWNCDYMRAVFTHITGIKRGQRETIDEPQISVGRAPSTVLAFAPADTRASAHHAEIAFDGTGYVLRDAGSTNGTYVNNRRVYSARLKPGDVIEFGTGGPRVQFDLESEPRQGSTFRVRLPRVASTAGTRIGGIAEKSHD